MEPVASLEQQIKTRIDSLAYLPTTVAVAMRFIELGKDPEAEPDDYAKVISSDASLASKLLSLANSSWFGVRNKVTKPKIAVNLLGLGTVRTLAVSYCLTGLHNELRLTPDESRLFWSASLCKAVAAREFAALFDAKAAEEAFTLGLFQDFAIPVMFACAREKVDAILNDRTLDADARLQKERELFRMDHAELGRAIAQKLELPELYVDAISFHHRQASLKEFLPKPILADAAHIAALFPHRLNAWSQAEAAALQHFLAQRDPAHPIDPAEFLKTVESEFNRLYAYFESGDKPEIKLVELLEVATREAADQTTRLVATVQDLLSQAAAAGKEVHKMMKQHSQLEEAATRDPLTGTLNRDGFVRRAADLLSGAERCHTPAALAYLDLDHFKQLNDMLGHAAGDDALRKLVAAVQSCIRHDDFIGRLGGDEFVVMLANIPQDAAVSTAQRIVAKVAAEAVGPSPDTALRLSASAGLAWVNLATGPVTLEQLINAADALMYQSKRAGGNRITATTLTPPSASPAAPNAIPVTTH